MIKGAALFDWDGVLIDTYPHGLEAIPAVADKLKLKIPTKEEIALHWGLGIRHYVEKLWPGLPLDVYEAAYEKCGFKKKPVPPVAGAIEVLELFQKRYYMGLITNRDRRSLESRFGLAGISADHFDYIQPVENAIAPKPDPRVFDYVLYLVKNQDINGGPIFYVGDTPTDFYATKGTRIQFIGVLTGPTSREKFVEIGVPKENIIPSIKDLPSFWDR
jgi:phosphoglycolate phosphatase-like HAD superfamily hydrolase